MFDLLIPLFTSVLAHLHLKVLARILYYISLKIQFHLILLRLSYQDT